MITDKIVNQIAQVCVTVVLGFLAGWFANGSTPPEVTSWIVPDPHWSVYVVPPCAANPINTSAIGLTFRDAYRHAADLIAPRDDYRSHADDPNIVNGSVCP